MSLEKEIVVFDVDEVLFPLKATFITAFNARYGTNLNLSGYDCFSFPGWLFRDHRELHERLAKDGGTFPFFRWVGDQGYLTYTLPYEGAAETLRAISETGRRIGIVSYRGTEEDPDKIYTDGPGLTKDWLRRHNMPFHYQRFTDRKSEALRQIEEESGRRVLLFVEDHPANTVKVVEAGYRVILVDKPYNQPRLLPKAEGDPDDYGAEEFDQRAWDNTLASGLVQRIADIRQVLNLL